LRRIALAFRSFFGILFNGKLSEETAAALGLSRQPAAPVPAAAPPPTASASDGALQMLAILQRDSRLLDFLMEDISGYADEQVGAAIRELHGQCRDALQQYLKLAPVIDGVEGTFARIPAADPSAVKLIGNVPAEPPPGGILRHKGWRAASVQLPPLNPKQDLSVIAPAEIEIE
jgi:Domain of unknown function (DUF2760)